MARGKVLGSPSSAMTLRQAGSTYSNESSKGNRKRKADAEEDGESNIRPIKDKPRARCKKQKLNTATGVSDLTPAPAIAKAAATKLHTSNRSNNLESELNDEHEPGNYAGSVDNTNLNTVGNGEISDYRRIEALKLIPNVLGKFRKIEEAFRQITDMDLIYFFASDPNCTQGSDPIGSTAETEEIRSTVSAMMSQVMYSPEFARAILHPKTFQILVEWANWLTISSEKRTKKRIGDRNYTPKTLRVDLRAWFRFADGALSLTDIADYIQLHLYGVEFDDERLSPYALRCQKWQTITASRILRRMELSEPTLDGAETSFAHHTGLELVEDLTEDEKQAVHAAAARYNEEFAKTSPDPLPFPTIDGDAFAVPKAPERGRREHSEAFAKSPYIHINAFDLERMLEKIHQRHSNVKNEPMISRLLQAGKKCRLDHLAKESAVDRRNRVTRLKQQYETRKALEKESGDVKGKVRSDAKKRWASHIDTKLSFEESLAKAVKMENDGSEPQSDEDLEDAADQSVHQERPNLIIRRDAHGTAMVRSSQENILISGNQQLSTLEDHDVSELEQGPKDALRNHQGQASRFEDDLGSPKVSYKDYLPAESGESSEEE